MLYRQKYFSSFGIRVHVRVCLCECVLSPLIKKNLSSNKAEDSLVA